MTQDEREILSLIQSYGDTGVDMRALVERMHGRGVSEGDAASIDATRKRVERRVRRLLEDPSIPLEVTEGRPKRYRLPRRFTLPAELDSTMAMSVVLADRQLAAVFPSELYERLKFYTAKAGSFLQRNGSAQYGRLVDRICFHPEGYSSRMYTPDGVRQSVLDPILNALASNVRVRFRYQARYADYDDMALYDPLGLVVRDQIFYLVCTKRDSSAIRHLNLARIHGTPDLLDEPATIPPGFNLANYVADGAFERDSSDPASPALIQLSVTQSVKDLLQERKPGVEVIEDWPEEDEAWVQFEETPHPEFVWWILGLGDKVEVKAPKELRDQVAEIVQNMAGYYS